MEHKYSLRFVLPTGHGWGEETISPMITPFIFAYKRWIEEEAAYIYIYGFDDIKAAEHAKHHIESNVSSAEDVKLFGIEHTEI